MQVAANISVEGCLLTCEWTWMENGNNNNHDDAMWALSVQSCLPNPFILFFFLQQSPRHPPSISCPACLVLITSHWVPPAGLDRAPVSGAESGDSNRTFRPPRVCRVGPDNEIRSQLPLLLISRVQMLPVPGGGILNRVPLHRPTGAVTWHRRVASVSSCEIPETVTQGSFSPFS